MLIQQAETKEVFERYKQALGRVMGALYFEVLEPIYKEHPDVEPPEHL